MLYSVKYFLMVDERIGMNLGTTFLQAQLASLPEEVKILLADYIDQKQQQSSSKGWKRQNRSQAIFPLMNISSFSLDTGPMVFMQATYSISLPALESEPTCKDISLGLTALWMLTSVACSKLKVRSYGFCFVFKGHKTFSAFSEVKRHS